MAVELTPKSFPIGDKSLLDREHKVAFLCSRNMSLAGRPAIKKWLESLNPETDCVMCGNLQRLESDVLEALVGRNIPTILVLDHPFPPMWPIKLVEAIGDQKLLVVTTSDFLLPWVDKYGMADARNRFMISQAETVVIGFCRPGGQLDRQLKAANANVMVLNQYSTQLENVPQNRAGNQQQGGYQMTTQQTNTAMAAEPEEQYGAQQQ